MGKSHDLATMASDGFTFAGAVTHSGAVTATGGFDASAGFTPPTGYTIQAVTTEDKTRRKYSSIAQTTWHTAYSNLSTSITPLSNSSKLMFFVQIHYGVANQGSGSFFWQIREGTTVSTLNGDTSQTFPCFHQYRWSNTSSDKQYHSDCAVINGGILNNTSTATRTFNFYHRIQISSDITINRDGSNSSDTNQGQHSPTLASRCTILEVSA